MKRIKLKIYTLTLLGIMIIQSCGIKTNMLNNNYTVTPNPLEVKGDSVAITITANIPAKSFSPKANVKFQPYLQSAKGDVKLKEITIGGEKVTDAVDVKINSVSGGKITYTEKIAYNSDLKRVSLYPAFAVYVKGAYKDIDMSKDKKVLAEGTNTTALLLSSQETAKAMAFDVTPYEVTASSKNVLIYFPIDVDRFNPSFGMKGLFNNKTQVDSLKKVLKGDKNWVVKGITINAFASPDGELARNEGLSKGRSQSTFNYFRKELKKLGFTEANDENFKMGYSLSEDWAGYAKALQTSKHADAPAVLQIVNNKGISDDQREAQIKSQYPKFWEATKNVLLPALRRSELVVRGETPLKTDEELKTYYQSLDKLNELELLQLGKITTDLAQRDAVYMQMVTKYPEDWRGYNDLASVQIQAGNKSVGATNLDKANSISPDNGTVLLNMANLAMLNGEMAKASDLYKKAASKGADASYGMGLLAIKTGNYSEAVSQLKKSGKKDFNMALAQLLNGDASGAKATIDGMDPEKLTWNCYYLRAIIGARTSDQDMLNTNLTRSVQLNGDVRNMAKDDVEFIKYWNNPTFQAAIR
jgi:Flp pilus assembly protein TadD/outer membrane protein OmpA-like peptidoglycan-associated protein